MNDERLDFDAVKRKISFSSSSLNAKEVGNVVTQVTVMYEVIQEYMGSSMDLKIEEIKKGSYIFTFLADPQVWDTMVSLFDHAVEYASDFWDYIGSNVTWDITKLAFAKVISKNTDLSKKETEAFLNAAQQLNEVALKTGSNIEIDFKNRVIRITHPKEYYEYFKHVASTQEKNVESHVKVYFEELIRDFPPRSTKHKRKW